MKAKKVSCYIHAIFWELRVNPARYAPATFVAVKVFAESPISSRQLYFLFFIKHWYATCKNSNHFRAVCNGALGM